MIHYFRFLILLFKVFLNGATILDGLLPAQEKKIMATKLFLGGGPDKNRSPRFIGMMHEVYLWNKALKVA